MCFENGFRIAWPVPLVRNDKSCSGSFRRRSKSGVVNAQSSSFRRTPESILTFMRRFSRFLLGLFCAVLLTATARAPAYAAELDAATFFGLNMGDLKTEVADAKSEGKKALLVMFEQEGCPY